MALHKALVLFKLNSHAKMAPDSRARGFAEIGDLAQQLASMTERHPNFFQILVCEIGQN